MASPRSNNSHSYEFGPFKLNVEERTLLNEGRVVQLTPKVFDTLLILLERRGQLVRKDELMESLWPDSFVEERNLAQNIFLLRKALGDGEKGRRYIQTVPKGGYRFIAEVRALPHDTAAESPDAAHGPGAQDAADGPAPDADIGGGDRPAGQAAERAPRAGAGARRRVSKPLAALAGLALVVACGVSVLLLHRRPAVSVGEPATKAARDGNRAARPGAKKREANQYLKIGLQLWNQRTPDGIKKSVEYFQKAIEQETGDALAYASLADSYYLIHYYGLEGFAEGEAYRKSVEAASASLELDPSLAEAHMAMAMILPRDSSSSAAVETYFRKSIELDPSLATTRHRYSIFLVRNGRLEEALAEVRRAHDLDPTSAIINRALAHALFLSRQYDELIGLCRVRLDMDASDASARTDLIMSYIQKGMRAEAEAELRRLGSDEMGRLEALRLSGYMHALSGNRAEALRLARRFEREARNWPSYSTHCLAVIYAAMGRAEEALKYLGRAGELVAAGPEYQKEFFLNSLLFGPQFDPLRGDRRFAELLRRHTAP
jgi:DNA-binding winged helix-turn-helix (wHTH) protein/tetratricopeptide (TPR) repeat protein